MNDDLGAATGGKAIFSIADNQQGERKKKRSKGDGLSLFQKKHPDFQKTGARQELKYYF